MTRSATANRSNTAWAWRLFVALGVLQILLSLAALFGLGTWIQRVLERDPLDIQLAFIGVNATLLGIGMAAAYHKSGGELSTLAGNVRSFLASRPEIVPLRDDDFHQQFGAAAQIANSRVLIMNMSADGRYFATNRGRNEYFKLLIKSIQRNRSTRYRRLERWTTQSESWLRDLMDKLEGESNASLAILQDSGTDTMGLALSVQIVDGHTAWLVAIDDHNRRGEYRDVMVRDRAFADMIERYYNRLWDKGFLLLDNGAVTDEGKRFRDGAITLSR